MSVINIFRIVLTSLLFVSFLSACGTAQVRTESFESDLHDYEYMQIGEVDIHSQEKAAATNEELQAKMIEWEGFARDELKRYVGESRYKLADELGDTPESILVISLDVDLVYGNRAARYWGGFGAGKGSVDSVLTVVDPSTQTIKFKAVSESDLSMGAFGGDMQGVLKSNIKELIKQYPKPSVQ